MLKIYTECIYSLHLVIVYYLAVVYPSLFASGSVGHVTGPSSLADH